MSAGEWQNGVGTKYDSDFWLDELPGWEHWYRDPSALKQKQDKSKANKQKGCCCCCCVASIVSDSVRPHRWQPTRIPRPWDSPGKNTGVGYHFLLQCMKVKSESEVAQSCPTLSDPMDCSLPGSSVHGICTNNFWLNHKSLKQNKNKCNFWNIHWLKKSTYFDFFLSFSIF